MTSSTACILRLCSLRSDIQTYFNCNFIFGILLLQEECSHCKRRITLTIEALPSQDSIFKRLDLQNDFSCPDKAKESQMYQRLERKIEAAQKQHIEFMQAIQDKISMVSEQIQKEKGSVHQKKIDLWELKNQVMQLQEIIKQSQCQQEEGEQYYERQEGQYQQGEAEMLQDDSEDNSEGQECSRLKDLDQLLSSWGVQRASHASLI